MGYEQYGLSKDSVHPAQLILKSRACDRIQGPERLVHQQRAGFRGQCPCQTDPLLLTSGKLCRVSPSIIGGGQPNQIEQLIDSGRDPVFLPP